MPTGQDFVNVARTYVDVTWVEAGRSKELGVDCIGLVVCSLRELGFDPKDRIDYTKFDEFLALVKMLKTQFDEIEVSFTPPIGTLILFRGRDMYNHLGIYTEKDTIIHAYSDIAYNKVVENSFDPYWKLNVHSMYWYKGLTK